MLFDKCQKHSGKLVGGALGLIGLWFVRGRAFGNGGAFENGLCLRRQGEDVSFARWFVCWISQKATSGNLVGGALALIGLWFVCMTLEHEVPSSSR